jgi:hypothetical protein
MEISHPEDWLPRPNIFESGKAFRRRVAHSPKIPARVDRGLLAKEVARNVLPDGNATEPANIALRSIQLTPSSIQSPTPHKRSLAPSSIELVVSEGKGGRVEEVHTGREHGGLIWPRPPSGAVKLPKEEKTRSMSPPQAQATVSCATSSVRLEERCLRRPREL